MAAVVARITGGADPEAVRGYRRWTGGNPFFLDEVLRDERERGAGGRRARPRASARSSAGACGGSGSAADGILPLAAVAGQEFDLQQVAAVGGQAPAAEALEALDGALATGLVVQGAGPGRFAWAHALVADTLVASLPASRRARLHAQLAEHLAGEHAAGRVGPGRSSATCAPPRPSPRRRPCAAGSWRPPREASAALAHADAAGHLEAALPPLARGGRPGRAAPGARRRPRPRRAPRARARGLPRRPPGSPAPGATPPSWPAPAWGSAASRW